MTLSNLREALVERAGTIYTRRNPCAPGESPIQCSGRSPRRFSKNSATWARRQPSTRCRWRQLWRSAVQRMLASIQEAKRKSGSRSVLLSRRTAAGFCFAHHLQGRAVRSADHDGEGQAGSAAQDFHRLRDPPCEPHQVRAPRGGHVFWRAGEQLV